MKKLELEGCCSGGPVGGHAKDCKFRPYRDVDLRGLIMDGSYVPHPKSTKPEFIKGCHRLYNEVEALRRFIVDSLIDLAEERANEDPIKTSPQGGQAAGQRDGVQ